MLEKITFTKLMNLKNVVKIETINAEKLKQFGLTPYGLSLKKGKKVVLKDGESAYINDELIVRLDASKIYLHHLKVDEEAKAKKEAEEKAKADKEALEAKAKKENIVKEEKTQKTNQPKKSTSDK